MCVFLLTFDANDDDDDDSVVIHESPGSRLVTCYFFALFYCRCILSMYVQYIVYIIISNMYILLRPTMFYVQWRLHRCHSFRPLMCDFWRHQTIQTGASPLLSSVESRIS